MSILSETLAEIEANRLADVLRKGLKTENKSVIEFLKKEVYPLYTEEIRETFGCREDEEIKKNYNWLCVNSPK